ncbi:MAG: HEAT repeat domain-containing protein [Bryobacteraceae bacterium]|nr:HEAT repeat domain-containing protein [Bryobacteraceae bacterium]
MSSKRLVAALCVCVCLDAAAQETAKDRAKAARELGRQGSESIPKLQPYLSDSELDVRLEAIKALVEIGTQYSLEPLMAATRDNDPEIQIRATDGLVNFYLPGYVKTGLTARLKRAGSRITATFGASSEIEPIPPYITVRPDVIETLGKLTRGGSTMEARANAARAVGVLRGQAAIPDLLAALRTKDDQVLYESLMALQKIRDPSVAPKIAFLLRDLNEKVQIAAIETTGLLQNREALPALREAFQRARSKKVQRAALGAIAMIPDEENRALYRQYFNDKDAAIRAAAAEGIARLGAAQDAAEMEKAFGEERSASPRLARAFAVVGTGKAEISEFSALQYLINSLNSRAWRGVAQPYLVELARKPDVRTSLHTALTKGTRDEKTGLLDVLARSGGQDSLRHVDEMTRDTDPEVAQAAIRAAKTIRARL